MGSGTQIPAVPLLYKCMYLFVLLYILDNGHIHFRKIKDLPMDMHI